MNALLSWAIDCRPRLSTNHLWECRSLTSTLSDCTVGNIPTTVGYASGCATESSTRLVFSAGSVVSAWVLSTTMWLAATSQRSSTLEIIAKLSLLALELPCTTRSYTMPTICSCEQVCTWWVRTSSMLGVKMAKTARATGDPWTPSRDLCLTRNPRRRRLKQSKYLKLQTPSRNPASSMQS